MPLFQPQKAGCLHGVCSPFGPPPVAHIIVWWGALFHLRGQRDCPARDHERTPAAMMDRPWRLPQRVDPCLEYLEDEEVVFAPLRLSPVLPLDPRKLSPPGLSPRIVLEDVTSSARGGRKGCSTWWTWNTSANSNSCNTGRSGRSAGDWGSRATPSPSIFPPPIPRPGIVRRSLVPGQCWGPSKA